MFLFTVSIRHTNPHPPRVAVTFLPCSIVANLPRHIYWCVGGYLVTPRVNHSFAVILVTSLAHLAVPPAALLLVLDGVLALHHHRAVLGVGPAHRAGDGLVLSGVLLRAVREGGVGRDGVALGCWVALDRERGEGAGEA
jgi:hypothetical protein